MIATLAETLMQEFLKHVFHKQHCLAEPTLAFPSGGDLGQLSLHQPRETYVLKSVMAMSDKHQDQLLHVDFLKHLEDVQVAHAQWQKAMESVQFAEHAGSQFRALSELVVHVGRFTFFVGACQEADPELSQLSQYGPERMKEQATEKGEHCAEKCIDVWHTFFEAALKSSKDARPPHWKEKCVDKADEKWICDNLLSGWLERVKPHYNMLSGIAQAFPLAGLRCPMTQETTFQTLMQAASADIIKAFGQKSEALEEVHTRANDIKVLSGCARVYNCIFNKWPKAKDMLARKQLARDAKKALTDKGVVVPDAVLRRLQDL